VTPPSTQAKMPHTATAIFAALCGLLRARGIGAPEIVHLRGTGAQKLSRPRRNYRALVTLATGLALVSILGVSAASAFAEEPTVWWGLSTAEQPMSLHPGTAKGAVFDLTISATSGEYGLIEETQSNFRLVAWDAPDSVVQSALEELYPQSKVEVTGTPGPEGESYTVTFPGQAFCSGTVKASCVQAPLGVNAGLGVLGKGPLAGGKAEVTLTEIFAGAPGADGQLVVDAQDRGYAGTSEPSTITDVLPC
jgi:hypothetical protein